MDDRPILVLPEFLKKVEKLPKSTKSKIFKALKLLSANVYHPSLQCKKILSNKKDVYECRVDQKIRLIFDITPIALRCWYVGEHDTAININRMGFNQPIIVDDIEITDDSLSTTDKNPFLFNHEDTEFIELKIDSHMLDNSGLDRNF